MRRFYTFRRSVRLLPGQVVRFVKGRGYYAFGKVSRKAFLAKSITMYDSVNVTQIPLDAEAVAGYVNGIWPTFSKLKAGFPRAHKLSVAVAAQYDADCLDVERGDALVADAPEWVQRQIARKVHRPVVYTSVSQARTLLDMLRARGIARDQIRLWTAHYTHKPHRCTAVCGFGFTGEADATQYSDHAFDRNLDASLCSPTFFG